MPKRMLIVGLKVAHWCPVA